MKRVVRYLLGLFICLCACHAWATIIIDGRPAFKAKVEQHLVEAKVKSPYLSALITAAERSKRRVYIKPITNDKSTWHYSGKKSRSHTEALDNKKRGAQRNTPTDAVIFINKNRITREHKTYKSGTLIHEFVHAVDLIGGKYHGDYKIRERRAIFFQNIWRSLHGKTLRADYHDRFKTLDYQNALRENSLEKFVNDYFSSNALP